MSLDQLKAELEIRLLFGGISIPKDEALARLSDEPELECWFECRPNTGTTMVSRWPRQDALAFIHRAPIVFEAGIQAQERDHGIYLVTQHPERGKGFLFFPTKLEARRSKEQLAESKRRHQEAHL